MHVNGKWKWQKDKQQMSQLKPSVPIGHKSESDSRNDFEQLGWLTAANC